MLMARSGECCLGKFWSFPVEFLKRLPEADGGIQDLFRGVIRREHIYLYNTYLSLAENSGGITGYSTAAAGAALPIPISVWVTFFCVQTMVWLTVFGIFNVHTDIDACDCTRRLYGHCKRVCAGS